ncbi:MAG: ATP-binding protein [Lachnospiraceae bacterium]|nr:ATP-binding protein [Lachnospiraceae bacterium]
MVRDKTQRFLKGNREVQASPPEGGGESIEKLLSLVRITIPPESGSYQPVIRRDRQKQLIYYLKMLTDPTEQSHFPEWGNVLCLYGPRGIGKREMLLAAASALKLPLLFIDTKKLIIANALEMSDILEELARRSEQERVVCCFDRYELAGGGEEVRSFDTEGMQLHFLLEWAAQSVHGIVWLAEEKPGYLYDFHLHTSFLEFPMLRVREREILWRHETKKVLLAEDVDLQQCANQYIVTPESLKEVIRDAGLRAGNRVFSELLDGAARTDEEEEEAVADSVDRLGRITKEDIREAVSDQVRNQLGALATYVRTIYTWEDLVIADSERRQLQMICDQVRYRSTVGEEWGFYRKSSYGHGLCALFFGSPGTGKTMAAHVIANELGLSLYRVDLSQMVSKYIGETEKNISELFDKAKNTNALLFFDEADALFSKRTEVKDVHDKNANAETAHLLQRLEDYEGITVLATNYANNIDDAFKRRIKFMVHFVFPDAAVRKTLWRTILPEEMPWAEELALDFFAERFELAGSGIKEVLHNAAYLAASEGRGLLNQDIVEALCLHFAKLGKVLSRTEDFRGL